MDLFASRLSHQVPSYLSWKVDPFSRGRDAFQHCWTHLKGYAFPPFCLIGRVLQKVQLDQATLIMITPAWQSQSWYPKLLQLSIQNPILIPQCKDLLINPEGMQHPLAFHQKLQLVIWTVSGKQARAKSYQKTLPNLSLRPEGEVQKLITSLPGKSGIAGVLRTKLIPFDVL